MSRRIYDDEYKNDELVNGFCDTVMFWVKDVFSRQPGAFYRTGSRDRIGVKEVKNSITDFFRNRHKDNIIISEIVHHAHNIGNNNAFEVFEYDKTKNEQTCLCYLNLVDDMFGGVYLSVLDFPNKKRVSNELHLRISGVVRSN